MCFFCVASFRSYSPLWCVGFFFFKQETAYEMRISDWSSDVCSSDLNLKFGMSFAESTGLTGLSRFNPAAVKGCLLELAVRGCYLTPDNNLISYTSVDGIPYTLALSFNRFDKLTDISLKYEREKIGRAHV